MNYTQISDRLPSFFHATNDYEHGCYRCSKSVGIQRAIIQANPKSYQFRMVFDIDYEVFPEFIAEDRQVLEPNWIAINPKNGHAHVAYELEIPVHRYDGASYKALNYAAKIQHVYTKKLGADRNYSEFLMKNPVSIAWDVHHRTNALRKLEDLAEFILPGEFPKYITKRVAETCHLGRNCHLFNTLRRWAYKAIRDFWGGSLERWRSMCRNQAELFNIYTNPLPLSEVKSCAYSVAKWTWNKITAREFSRIQQKRSIAANEKRWAPSQQHREDMQVSARLMRAKGMPYRMIGEMLGIDHSRIYRWLNETT